LEELIKYIVENLVDNKESISISSVEESEKVTVVTVLVDKNDIGKVIGRNGKVAGSIRTIVKSASMGTGKRFIVKIGERD
jgi:predicted RNA-binding protein YlqC (UPF0109 family)